MKTKFICRTLILLLMFFIINNFEADAAVTSAGSSISKTLRAFASNSANATSSHTATVSAIYGETTADAISGSMHNNSASLGETVYVIYRVYNTGNTSDSFLVNIGNLQYSGGSSGWDSSVIIDKNGTVKNQSYIIGPIAEEGSETFAVRITVSSNVVNAPDNSLGYCTVAVGAYSTALTGVYTGDNSTQYALTNANIIWTDTAVVATAVLAVTKNCTGVTLAGIVTADTKPGSTIWYEIEYSNNGSANATQVYMCDEIDTTVVFDTLVAGNAAGWTVYYSTNASEAPAYGAAGGWTSVIPADKSTIRCIKWDKASVLTTEDNRTFGYTVIIK